METRNQDDLKTLDFSSIFVESFEITLIHRKLFTTKLLPASSLLSFLFMAQTPVFWLLPSGSSLLNFNRSGENSDLAFWVFAAAYYSISMVLLLFPISVVVFTVAWIYTHPQKIGFKIIMGVLPKLWKKLNITFIWASVIILAYLLVAWSTLNARVIIENAILFAALSIPYALGFMYIIMVWNMANAVSVLEDVYGIKAIMKGNALVKHNIGTVVWVFSVYVYFYMVLQLPIQLFVVLGNVRERVLHIALGVTCFLLMSMVILFGYVVVSGLP
ncbi:uncharacterized protein LOC115688784 [Syzygium oleosum]|uniref:uncharacterized protein LOC115688784 n=1 Tax=Syzygium oleosum TaxID=219896 RepID=UPI0011D1FBDD|nr:uncharacterized protein LOC115688784 [Syzygium oleosum]